MLKEDGGFVGEWTSVDGGYVVVFQCLEGVAGTVYVCLVSPQLNLT